MIRTYSDPQWDTLRLFVFRQVSSSIHTNTPTNTNL